MVVPTLISLMLPGSEMLIAFCTSSRHLNGIADFSTIFSTVWVFKVHSLIGDCKYDIIAF